MKKNNAAFAALGILLLLASCNSQSLSSGSSSSSSESTSEPVSQTSSADLTSVYVDFLSKQQPFYSLRTSYQITKDSVVFKDAYDLHEINVTDKIEHINGYYTVIAGYDSNDSTDTETYNIYKLPGYTYSQGYDYKYDVEVADNSFAAYRLDFDFSSASGFSAEQTGVSEVTLTGQVDDAEAGSFLKTSASGIEGLALKVIMSSDGGIKEIRIDYTQKGYGVDSDYILSYIEPSILLPTF